MDRRRQPHHHTHQLRQASRLRRPITARRRQTSVPPRLRLVPRHRAIVLPVLQLVAPAGISHLPHLRLPNTHLLRLDGLPRVPRRIHLHPPTFPARRLLPEEPLLVTVRRRRASVLRHPVSELKILIAGCLFLYQCTTTCISGQPSNHKTKKKRAHFASSARNWLVISSTIWASAAFVILSPPECTFFTLLAPWIYFLQSLKKNPGRNCDRNLLAGDA